MTNGYGIIDAMNEVRIDLYPVKGHKLGAAC